MWILYLVYYSVIHSHPVDHSSVHLQTQVVQHSVRNWIVDRTRLRLMEEHWTVIVDRSSVGWLSGHMNLERLFRENNELK